MIDHRPKHGNVTGAAFIFSLLVLFSSCRSLETIDSQWSTIPAGPQGQMDDFSKKITSHLYENGLLAGIGNDEKYLYIMFSPDIRHHVRPPSRASLTLWLDASGKKTRKHGLFYTRVYFPEGADKPRPAIEPGPAGMHGNGRGEPPAAEGPLLQMIDRPGQKQSFISPDGSQGPQVHFSSDWGDFVYSWRIPLQAAMKDNFFALDAKPGQAVSVGLLWEIKPLFAAKNPADRPEDGFGPGNEPPPDGGGGRTGNPMGGGMGRGGRGPGSDFSELPSRRTIWLKAVLAQK